MKYAFPAVGRTGLGNMLFPWAQAALYCRETGAKMVAPRWTSFLRIGPILRGEYNKRYYLNEFTNKGYVSGLKACLVKCFCKDVRIFKSQEFGDWFDSLLVHREYLCAELERIVSPAILRAVQAQTGQAFIGVHIRRGDFVTNGQWISDDWYNQAIQRAQSCIGDLPIWIFSDSHPDALKGILRQHPSARLMPKAPAIQDILMLACSKFLVATSRSTFSMWAVFLGQMNSIWSNVDRPPRLYVDGRDVEHEIFL